MLFFKEHVFPFKTFVVPSTQHNQFHSSSDNDIFADSPLSPSSAPFTSTLTASIEAVSPTLPIIPKVSSPDFTIPPAYIALRRSTRLSKQLLWHFDTRPPTIIALRRSANVSKQPLWHVDYVTKKTVCSFSLSY